MPQTAPKAKNRFTVKRVNDEIRRVKKSGAEADVKLLARAVLVLAGVIADRNAERDRCPNCGGFDHADPLPGTTGRRCVRCCGGTIMTEPEMIAECRKAAARAKRMLIKAWPLGTAVSYKRHANSKPEIGTVEGVTFSPQTGEPLIAVRHYLGRPGEWWDNHFVTTGFKPSRLTRIDSDEEPDPEDVCDDCGADRHDGCYCEETITGRTPGQERDD